jgi:hypothetical protein
LHPPIATRLWGRQLATPGCRQLQLPVDMVPACRPGSIDHRPEPRSVHADPPAPPQALVAYKDRASPRQTSNRLHRLLLDLVPGGARRNLSAKRAAVLLAAVTPAGAPAPTRWQLAAALVADARHLEPRIATVDARSNTTLAQATTSLVQSVGRGAGAGGHVPGRGRRPAKLAAGRSPKEALRCRQRRLSDAVSRWLVTDQAARPAAMATST